jgi:5-methylcytosine-specific restriction endonuclease McrA
MSAVRAREVERSSLRDPTTLRALVLNAPLEIDGEKICDARPLSTWPLSLVSAQEAISTVWRDRATVVETWEGAFFRSPSITIAVPKVVMLRQYAPVTGEPKFCRRSILLRDHFRCQYCGERFDSRDLTFDHVVPRSRGGRTVWTNIASACLRCNSAKADRPTMRPRTTPQRPTNMQLLQAGLEFLANDLRDDFGSWLYWGAELIP